MIRPVSKTRTLQFVNDFQVFKGACENSMKTFGQPVVAAHEAELMIRDDKNELAPGVVALYAIHQRSENRIIKIVNAVGKAKVVEMPMARTRVLAMALPKAA
jgi:hypothetical protein